MPNSDNIQTARPRVTGVFFTAPSGTALPADATTTLTAAFAELGYVSEDGITETYDKSTDILREMGGSPVAALNSANSVEYKLTALEDSASIEEMLLGSGQVTTDGSGNIQAAVINGADVPPAVFAFDMLLRSGKKYRLVLPNAQVTAIGDLVYKAGGAMSREVTITCFPDSAGNKVYKYWEV